MITDSLFLSDGRTYTNGKPVCGIQGPMTSWLTIANTAFSGFAANEAAICACELCNGGKGGQEVRTKGLRFLAMPSASKVLFKHHHFEAIFHDLDGSLTGFGADCAPPFGGEVSFRPALSVV